jgi:hypothetical protein
MKSKPRRIVYHFGAQDVDPGAYPVVGIWTSACGITDQPQNYASRSSLRDVTCLACLVLAAERGW